MVFAYPILLLGLLAMPAVVAIYWLRQRSRRTPVSSLLLWSDQRQARQGGRVLQRLQTPLTLLLELLTILLLVLAAAGLSLRQTQYVRPLIVVLDDSYSMLAGLGGDDSPRARGAAALTKEFADNNYSARLVLAGTSPRMTGETISSPQQLAAALAAWKCQSPAGDLSRAVALATELSGPGARILVITDSAPPSPPTSGQIQWWAFGQQQPNVAFTAATRSEGASGQRVLLEVTNLSDTSARQELTLEGGNLSAPRKSAVELAPGQAKQFILDLPENSPPLWARLGHDALVIDNDVLLLNESAKPVRVRLAVSDEKLRRLFSRAMEATGLAILSDDRPELTIQDMPSPGPAGDGWRMDVPTAPKATPYVGPFVIDRQHPLAQGLSLQGAIWACPADAKLQGTPVLTAGNVVLLATREGSQGDVAVEMAFDPKFSNLQDTPDWPILMTNLLRWRQESLPGILHPNIRLGQPVRVQLPRGVKSVELLSPDGNATAIPANQRNIEIPVPAAGAYKVRYGQGGGLIFACNALNRQESDLSHAQTDRWGSWNSSEVCRDRQIDLGWALLLAALLTMAAHQFVLHRTRNGGGK